jgi:hypothetical protein
VQVANAGTPVQLTCADAVRPENKTIAPTAETSKILARVMTPLPNPSPTRRDSDAPLYL